MNRFSWVTAGEYSSGERVALQQRGVRLYDGDGRVSDCSGEGRLGHARIIYTAFFLARLDQLRQRDGDADQPATYLG